MAGEGIVASSGVKIEISDPITVVVADEIGGIYGAEFAFLYFCCRVSPVVVGKGKYCGGRKNP